LTQFDGAELGAGGEIEDEEPVFAVRQRQFEDEAIAAGGHGADLRAMRQVERRLGEAALSRPAPGDAVGDDGGDDGEPGDDQNPHDDDEDFQPAHGGAPAGKRAAKVGDSVTVDSRPEDAGVRLDRVLARHLPALSRTRLKALIEAGRVRCESTVARDPAARVLSGQSFVVALPEPEEARMEPQARPLAIRYEDAHLLVIDKPAGLVVHPAPGNSDGTLVNALLAHCGDSLEGIGGVLRPGIVHRLDKDTSGLMVVAKTEAAHRALSQDFAARHIERAYAAFVWGVPDPAIGEISGNIGRHPVHRKKMAVLGPGRGRTALTRYRVERAFADRAALIECRLATGRTHQIRVHLAARGHPLIGDQVYGSRRGRTAARGTENEGLIAAFPRQALHARTLGFVHPATGVRLDFASPLPVDLHILLNYLERL
jgi:23S rRNA pseudouridine1911/1915/1917 synthase